LCFTNIGEVCTHVIAVLYHLIIMDVEADLCAVLLLLPHARQTAKVSHACFADCSATTQLVPSINHHHRYCNWHGNSLELSSQQQQSTC
jgi:hypothetical protein